MAPLAPDERSEDSAAVIASYKLGDRDTPPNVFTTVARHPELLRRWMRFNSLMLVNGDLPPRDRELVILRTVWLCGAEYEWGHHQRFAALVGLRPAEIGAVIEGPGHADWDDRDKLLLRATDELHRAAAITDATWAGLTAIYDERQVIELCMLAGSYHIAAFTINSLGIQLEAGMPGFPHHPAPD
jgi:4-carboxymuconolactone decarboxylase